MLHEQHEQYEQQNDFFHIYSNNIDHLCTAHIHMLKAYENKIKNNKDLVCWAYITWQ